MLENLQNAPEMTVDVYLGKERFNTDLDGIPRAMLNGWLGSVPYQNSMTYGDLLKTVRQLLPVSIIDNYMLIRESLGPLIDYGGLDIPPRNVPLEMPPCKWTPRKGPYQTAVLIW